MTSSVPRSGGRAGARAYAVPAALLVLAVALAGVVVALRWNQISAGKGEPVTGRAGGVEARLVSDQVYDVYADADSVATDGTACVLNPRDGSRGGLVTLRKDRDDAPDVSQDGTTYVYVGSFTSTVAAESIVSCAAASDGMLLRPRGTPYLPTAALLGVVALVLAAGASFVAVRVRRRG